MRSTSRGGAIVFRDTCRFLGYSNEWVCGEGRLVSLLAASITFTLTSLERCLSGSDEGCRSLAARGRALISVYDRPCEQHWSDAGVSPTSLSGSRV